MRVKITYYGDLTEAPKNAPTKEEKTKTCSPEGCIHYGRPACHSKAMASCVKRSWRREPKEIE